MEVKRGERRRPGSARRRRDDRGALGGGAVHDAWKETRPFRSHLNASTRRITRQVQQHTHTTPTCSAGLEMHAVPPLLHVMNIWQVNEPCRAVCIDNLGGFGERTNGNGWKLHSNDADKVSTTVCNRPTDGPTDTCVILSLIFPGNSPEFPWGTCFSCLQNCHFPLISPNFPCFPVFSPLSFPFWASKGGKREKREFQTKM